MKRIMEVITIIWLVLILVAVIISGPQVDEESHKRKEVTERNKRSIQKLQMELDSLNAIALERKYFPNRKLYE